MSRLLAATALLIGSVFGVAFPAAAQDPDPGPQVAITPATAIEDGDLVEVSGSGFQPGITVFLLLCNGDVRLGGTIGRCALIGEGSAGYLVDSLGNFKATGVAVPVGQVGATGLATCPPSAAQIARGVSCSIGTATIDLLQVAGSEIVYGGQQPAAQDQLAFTGPHTEALLALAMTLLAVGLIASTAGLWARKSQMAAIAARTAAVAE